jgi:hypothetical protein
MFPFVSSALVPCHVVMNEIDDTCRFHRTLEIVFSEENEGRVNSVFQRY